MSQKDVNQNKYKLNLQIGQYKNLDAISLYSYEKWFVIKANKDITNIQTILKIERKTGIIYEIEQDDLLHDKEAKLLGVQNFSSLIGIIHIEDKPFLLLSKHVKLVCMKENQEIFEIQSVFFNNFEMNYNYGEGQGKVICDYMANILKLLTQGFYFSYGIDLTVSEQKQQNGDYLNQNFMWNKYLMTDLTQHKIDKQWQIPVIQGYIKQFSWNLAGRRLDYYLISRRSRHNAGIKQYTRGIDDEGNVANFIETEQIIYYNKFICSIVMIRDQKNDNLNDLFSKTLNKIIETFGFFTVDQEKNNSVIWRQNGVIRLNCLECHDRTDVAMSKLAIKALQIQMMKMGIDLKSPSLFGAESIEILDSQLKNNHPFITIFKEIWEEQSEQLGNYYRNGQNNKVQYQNMKTKGFLDFVDQSLQNITKINGNSLEDHTKQESIDILLGEHHLIQNLFEKSINQQLKNRVRDYCNFQNISIYAVTWNMNGKFPKNSNINGEGSMTQNLFNFNGCQRPDIIVVGLQEMVKLNTKNVIMTNNEKITDLWKQELTKTIGLLDDYILIKDRDLVGIFIAVFAKNKLQPFISRVDSDEVKTGLMGGTFGNKGACLIRMKIYNSTLCFTNCHLESGQKQFNERVQSINEIHRKGFENKKKEFSFGKECDYSIFMGDMNFRISLNNLEVRQQLQKVSQDPQPQKILDYLLYNDQLNQNKNKSYLKYYQEGKIDFQPTYKYDNQSTNYDTSKKMRTPSWTDRVLIWPKLGLKYEQLFYKRIEQRDTDHRPVASYYNIQVREINEELLEEVKKQIYNQQKMQQSKQQSQLPIQHYDEFESADMSEYFFKNIHGEDQSTSSNQNHSYDRQQDSYQQSQFSSFNSHQQQNTQQQQQVQSIQENQNWNQPNQQQLQSNQLQQQIQDKQKQFQLQQEQLLKECELNKQKQIDQKVLKKQQETVDDLI